MLDKREQLSKKKFWAAKRADTNDKQPARLPLRVVGWIENQ
jgi:hypothetical protein